MDLFIQLPILLFSIIFHEVAHGRMALRHGDDTALRLGRLTFNPIAHIDPVGTVLLPLMCFSFHWPMFGWAKPVPVDPFSFRKPRKGMVQVAAAGPLSNIFLCVAAAVFLRVLVSLPPVIPGFMISLGRALQFAVYINMGLAFFNLIPIHPLDGSRIVAGLLPLRMAMEYEKHVPYGIVIILALVSLGLVKFLVLIPYGLFLMLLRSVLGMPWL